MTPEGEPKIGDFGFAGQKETFKILSGEYKPPLSVEFKEGKKLKDFQKLSATLFESVGRLLIADEVGLGKTVQAIACMMGNNKLPALVVVQTHLPNQWKEKIEEFCNLKATIIKTGKVYELEPSDVYIIKYNHCFIINKDL